MMLLKTGWGAAFPSARGLACCSVGALLQAGQQHQRQFLQFTCSLLDGINGNMKMGTNSF